MAAERWNLTIVGCLAFNWCGWAGLVNAVKTIVRAVYQCWTKQEEAGLGFRVCRWSPSGPSLSACEEDLAGYGLEMGSYTKAAGASADLLRNNTHGLEEDDGRNFACIGVDRCDPRPCYGLLAIHHPDSGPCHYDPCCPLIVRCETGLPRHQFEIPYEEVQARRRAWLP